VIFGSTAPSVEGMLRSASFAPQRNNGSELFTITDPNYLVNTAHPWPSGTSMAMAAEIIACAARGTS